MTKPNITFKQIKVLPYNPNYPQMFEAEADLIKQALGKHYINIEHIGSTSVPKLIAKQDLDIVCVVDELLNSLLLQEIGYVYKGELNIPLRYYFSKNTEHSKVNLHVVEPNHWFITLNLCFRNYLRLNDDVRIAYANLKENLLKDPKSYQKTNNGFTGYNFGKNQFIKSILQQAGYNELHVNFCMHPEEWLEYHRIKEEQIFNPIKVVYDRMHISITDSNHKHFVLYKGIKIVAIAHMELFNKTEVALRALATDELYKNNGYGTYLINFLEKWVTYQNLYVIKMHARLSAEHFYRKLGYNNMAFDDRSISESYINLGKKLT